MNALRRTALLLICCGLMVPSAGCSGGQEATTSKPAQPEIEDAETWKNPSVEGGYARANDGYMKQLDFGDYNALLDLMASHTPGENVLLEEGIECGVSASLVTLSGRLFTAGRERARAGLLPLSVLEVQLFLAENKNRLQVELTLPLQHPVEVHPCVVEITQAGIAVSSLETDLSAAAKTLTIDDFGYRAMFTGNSCAYPYELSTTLELDIALLDPAKGFEVRIHTRTRTATLAVLVRSVNGVLTIVSPRSSG